MWAAWGPLVPSGGWHPSSFSLALSFSYDSKGRDSDYSDSDLQRRGRALGSKGKFGDYIGSDSYGSNGKFGDYDGSDSYGSNGKFGDYEGSDSYGSKFKFGDYDGSDSYGSKRKFGD